MSWNDSYAFKCIENSQNPADLITRGISLKALKNKVDLWTRGPDWLQQDEWPTYPLLSMDPKTKIKINTMILF